MTACAFHPMPLEYVHNKPDDKEEEILYHLRHTLIESMLCSKRRLGIETFNDLFNNSRCAMFTFSRRLVTTRVKKELQNIRK